MRSGCKVTNSGVISRVLPMRKCHPTSRLSDITRIDNLFLLSLFSRRFDLANERLPEFDPEATSGIFPAPSMRRGPDMENMEILIRQTLEEVDEAGRPPQGRPQALRRFETA
jgi:hypothetical protein